MHFKYVGRMGGPAKSTRTKRILNVGISWPGGIACPGINSRRISAENKPVSNEGSYTVEYVNYNLILLAILVALLIWLMLPSRSRSDDQIRSNSVTSRQRLKTKAKPNKATGQTHAAGATHKKQKSGRDLSKIPIPWGWPQHQKHSLHNGEPATAMSHTHSMSESLHHLADVLIREKHTVDDADYRLKRETSMRTLMEDRYGRATVKTRKKLARLSRTARPSGNALRKKPGTAAGRVESRPLRKGQTGEISLYKRQKMPEMQRGLKKLKMPWGW
jgi:hypothetical protein